MPLLCIIFGSRSDIKVAQEAKLADLLQSLKLGKPACEMSIVSAHRHCEKLPDYLSEKLSQKTLVFIGVAGMAAHLPGSIAALTGGMVPVLGVPLPSAEFPDAADAMLSMTRMPPGTPVMVAGVGKSGLTNAVIAAAQMISLTHEDVREALEEYRRAKNPPAEIDIEVPEKEK